MTNVITLTRIVYSAELFFCPVKSAELGCGAMCFE